jgi:hypothetical protein
MTIESFGIPDTPAQAAAVDAVVGANTELLRAVIGEVAGSVFGTLASNQAQLDRVRKAARRSVGRSVASNSAGLGQIRDALGGQMTAALAANQAQLNLVQQAVAPLPTGQESGLPPTWFVNCSPGGGGSIVANTLGSAGIDQNSLGPFYSVEEAQAAIDSGICTRGPISSDSIPISSDSIPIQGPPVCCPPQTINVTVEPPKRPPPLEQPSLPGLPPELDMPEGVLCALTGQGNFYKIGSPEWCQCLDQVVKWVTRVGNNIESALILPVAGGTGALRTVLEYLSRQLLNFLPVDFISKVIGLPAIDALMSALQNSYKALKRVSIDANLCDASTLLGIALVRGLINVFSEVHIGADIPFLAAAKLSLHIPQLNLLMDYVSNYVCRAQVPSPAEAIECHLKGTIGVDQLKCWLGVHGVDLDVIDPLIQARRTNLSVKETIEYLRRAGLSEAEQAGALRYRGFLNSDEARARVVLYDELPTTSDFLHFLTRNVFNKDYVQRYNLLDGFLDRFWANYGPYLRIRGMTQQWAAEHYAAHWVQPAPTQMQEFLYRLRPNKPGVTNHFTLADYQNILAEQDVAPLAQKWMAEVAYRVPALSYLRDMYRQYVIDDDQLLSYHQDLGYTKEDSANFVKIDRLQRDRMRARAAGMWEPRAAAQAAAAGVLPRDQLDNIFLLLGYSSDEAAQALERAQADLQRQVIMRARSLVIQRTQTEIRNAQLAGLMDVDAATLNMRNLGFPESFAHGVAVANAAQMGVALAKSAISRIKRALLSGEVTGEYARAALLQLGVDPGAIDQMALSWSLENTPNRKRRSAAQVTKDVAAGVMGTDEALVRLANLGYADADSRLFLADAQRQILGRQARLNAAAERSSRTQAAQVQRLQRQAQQQTKQLRSRLRRLSSPAKLQKWAKQGLISKTFFVARFRAMGYDDPDIERYYAEACAAKNAQCQTPPTPSEAIPPGPILGSPGGP